MKKEGYGFVSEEKDRVFLVRCFKCKKENHTPSVASGICAWCGYDANKDPNINQKIS